MSSLGSSAGRMQPSAFAVTLLGAPEVGKTALARNFCGDALQQEACAYVFVCNYSY